MSQSYHLILPLSMYGIEWGKYLVKNVCPPKQYLNGKNGIDITNPKYTANKHAAAFTDNSSSAHFSVTFQAIKEQEEKFKIDFPSDNAEVYNKPFRLRDLRQSIMKAKRCAPRPDGIHNNLLKHLPEDTLKILKEILNKIWTSVDFPHQWRAVMVIPIPKPNKDHTDLLSYIPNALTSCLCKVLEHMINNRFIRYLEKSRILDKSQCGFRKHGSTTDHLVCLERYLRDAFAQRQQAVGLFFDLEKAYETTWKYGIIRDLYRIGLRGRLPIFCVRLSQGPTNLSQNMDNTLMKGVPTGGVLTVTWVKSHNATKKIEFWDTLMNLLCLLSARGTCVRFCWIPSHWGIEGNEKVDQLAKETLSQDIDPLASVHYTDLKPLVNCYIQQLVQTKWDVAVHGRYIYLVKPTLGQPKKFQHLTRPEEVVISRLRIGHTKATKSQILSRGPPTACHHCGQTLSLDHILLECAVLQECRDEFYTADSLNALFKTIPETCIVEFLREAGFFYLIWMVRHSTQLISWTCWITPDLMEFVNFN